jgi:hypothetical protein
VGWGGWRGGEEQRLRESRRLLRSQLARVCSLCRCIHMRAYAYTAYESIHLIRRVEANGFEEAVEIATCARMQPWRHRGDAEALSASPLGLRSRSELAPSHDPSVTTRQSRPVSHARPTTPRSRPASHGPSVTARQSRPAHCHRVTRRVATVDTDRRGALARRRAVKQSTLFTVFALVQRSARPAVCALFHRPGAMSASTVAAALHRPGARFTVCAFVCHPSV